VANVDLSAQLAAARKAAEEAAARYVEASDALEQAQKELNAAQQRVKRIERALAILKGEDDATPPVPAEPAPSPVAAPPPPPPPQRPAGPYAHVKCSGCMEVGTLSEIMRPTKNNTMVRLLVCSTCGNETYLG